MAYLVEILFIVSLYQSSIDCYHVECNFYKDTSHLHIVGLRSFEDFKNYGIKCGDYDVVTLVYEDCYLGQITLPPQIFIFLLFLCLDHREETNATRGDLK